MAPARKPPPPIAPARKPPPPPMPMPPPRPPPGPPPRWADASSGTKPVNSSAAAPISRSFFMDASLVPSTNGVRVSPHPYMRRRRQGLQYRRSRTRDRDRQGRTEPVGGAVRQCDGLWICRRSVLRRSGARALQRSERDTTDMEARNPLQGGWFGLQVVDVGHRHGDLVKHEPIAGVDRHQP